MKLPELSAALLLVLIPTVYLLSRRFLDSKRKEKGVPFHLPTPEEALPHWKGKRISPVSIYDSNDPTNIQCYCPATGQSLGKFAAHTRDDINVIIDKAHRAQKIWKTSSFSERRTVLNTISKYINDHQEDVARIACRDTGKTMFDASLGEILLTLEKLSWIVVHGETALTVSKRPGPTNILMCYKGAEVRYEPLGVVSAMVSWNYPLHNLMGPIAAALFTGNAIVVKCSESVVWSSSHFIEIAKEALKINGFDEDLVQLVACWPQEADFLTSHPGLNHITFIGSRPVAHKVAVAAAVSLTPVVCELGGKDPLIVLDDVTDRTLDGIASIILRGTFQSSGQNCIGVERVIAVGQSYDKLIPILGKTISQLRLGSSIDQQEVIDMGSTINSSRFDILESLVEKAVAQGANLVHGGVRYNHPKYPQGHYFAPTLLTGVTQDMDIAQEEVFGPILLLFRAESADEAVELANSTEYGLGASVFGSSTKLLNEITDRLECGNVAINDFATYALCQLPFGGTKGSGYGKFGGTEGLRGLCVEKSVCYDRFPYIKTTIPRSLDYPIPDSKKAWDMVQAINEVGYGQGLFGRLRALQRLARNN